MKLKPFQTLFLIEDLDYYHYYYYYYFYFIIIIHQCFLYENKGEAAFLIPCIPNKTYPSCISFLLKWSVRLYNIRENHSLCTLINNSFDA